MSIHVEATENQAQSVQEEILKEWKSLTDEQRELLIPRLLQDTEVGRRVTPSGGVAWRPAYAD